MDCVTTKKCSLCQKYKDVKCFGKNKSQKDGYQAYCSDCRKIKYHEHKQANPEYFYLKSKKWREDNKEHKAQQDKLWVEKNRKKSNEIKKHWKLNHKEQNKLINKKYSEKTKDIRRIRNRQWRSNNPEKHNLKEARRRVRKFNNGIFEVSAKEIKQMLAKPCYYCGKESKHIDHIIPISRRWTTQYWKLDSSLCKM